MGDRKSAIKTNVSIELLPRKNSLRNSSGLSNIHFNEKNEANQRNSKKQNTSHHDDVAQVDTE